MTKGKLKFFHLAVHDALKKKRKNVNQLSILNMQYPCFNCYDARLE